MANQLDDPNLKILIKTLPGLEKMLAREVKQLGGRQVTEVKRGVKAEGDLGFVYKCNLWLRTALRVLVQLHQFKAKNEDDLYRKMKQMPWDEFFHLTESFAIDATVFSPHFTNSLYVAQRAKDAVVDRFRDKLKNRPNVDTKQPKVRINVHIAGDRVSVSLDSSGDSLHKRNYRQKADRAPLNEVLAAGIIMLSGWDKKSNFIDPMCGSGTFLIEAALMAYNIPPNIFRKSFCFRHWQNFDPELFELLFEKSLEKENSYAGRIIGLDIDHRVLSKAKINLKRALMDDQIELIEADFNTLDRAALDLPESGHIVMNPPYDIKMEADIPVLYKAIGDTLKQQFTGYQAWIFSASEEGLKNIGLKTDQRHALYNAKLESRLCGYRLY